MSQKTETPPKAAIPGPAQPEITALLDELSISPASNLIGVLQQVQDRFGFLPAGALHEMSRRMRIPLSRIYGVVSFYAQFYTTPRGKHTIRCCRGTACHVRGSKHIIQMVSSRLGLADGETDDDMKFSFETVACLGACALSPVVIIDGKYYGKMTPRRLEQILNRLVAQEAAVEEKT